ncbi:MAG: MoaD/ThiS family protein [Tepidiformaceae bacterium]
MPTVYLPAALERLVPGVERRVELDAATVEAVIDQLDRRWPGIRDRLCEPSRLRKHISVFVDGERATLATEVGADSEVRVIPAVSGGGLA